MPFLRGLQHRVDLKHSSLFHATHELCRLKLRILLVRTSWVSEKKSATSASRRLSTIEAEDSSLFYNWNYTVPWKYTKGEGFLKQNNLGKD
jgi:hypothetical protein